MNHGPIQRTYLTKRAADWSEAFGFDKWYRCVRCGALFSSGEFFGSCAARESTP